jgi:hypothetical protein
MDLNAIIVLDFISAFAFAWVGARVAASKNLPSSVVEFNPDWGSSYF